MLASKQFWHAYKILPTVLFFILILQAKLSRAFYSFSSAIYIFIRNSSTAAGGFFTVLAYGCGQGGQTRRLVCLVAFVFEQWKQEFALIKTYWR